MADCRSIFAAVVPENPNFREQVGTIWFPYIQSIVGPKASRVAGLFMDLPIEEIKPIMQDWSLF